MTKDLSKLERKKLKELQALGATDALERVLAARNMSWSDKAKLERPIFKERLRQRKNAERRLRRAMTGLVVLAALLFASAPPAHAQSLQMPTRYVGHWCGKETNAGSIEYRRAKAGQKCALPLTIGNNTMNFCPLTAISKVVDALGVVATYDCNDGHPGHHWSQRMMNYAGDVTSFTLEPISKEEE
jgi:hypothetical protein